MIERGEENGNRGRSKRKEESTGQKRGIFEAKIEDKAKMMIKWMRN